ncbi:hypothetical protein [Streptomyces sp. NPDC059224]|uniref:hypothetical protein n=1 Tax=Streptomyces sp. NPDC059224 TaxID=3346775 RepID=UPI0036ADA5C1
MNGHLPLDCPGCHTGWRTPRQLLCPDCWPQLPHDTRTRLQRRDVLAERRRTQLRAALRDRIPLGVIRVIR